MSTPLKFIPPRVPFLDARSGLISREWYLFLQGIFLRTGGESGVDPATINILIDNLTAIFRPINTSQIEQLLAEVVIQLQAAQRPQADLRTRIEQLEAQMAALERRSGIDTLRSQVSDLAAYTFIRV